MSSPPGPPSKRARREEPPPSAVPRDSAFHAALQSGNASALLLRLDASLRSPREEDQMEAASCLPLLLRRFPEDRSACDAAVVKVASVWPRCSNRVRVRALYALRGSRGFLQPARLVSADLVANALAAALDSNDTDARALTMWLLAALPRLFRHRHGAHHKMFEALGADQPQEALAAAAAVRAVCAVAPDFCKAQLPKVERILLGPAPEELRARVAAVIAHAHHDLASVRDASRLAERAVERERGRGPVAAAAVAAAAVLARRTGVGLAAHARLMARLAGVADDGAPPGAAGDARLAALASLSRAVEADPREALPAVSGARLAAAVAAEADDWQRAALLALGRAAARVGSGRAADAAAAEEAASWPWPALAAAAWPLVYAGGRAGGRALELLLELPAGAVEASGGAPPLGTALVPLLAVSAAARRAAVRLCRDRPGGDDGAARRVLAGLAPRPGRAATADLMRCLARCAAWAPGAARAEALPALRKWVRGEGASADASVGAVAAAAAALYRCGDDDDDDDGAAAVAMAARSLHAAYALVREALAHGRGADACALMDAHGAALAEAAGSDAAGAHAAERSRLVACVNLVARAERLAPDGTGEAVKLLEGAAAVCRPGGARQTLLHLRVNLLALLESSASAAAFVEPGRAASAAVAAREAAAWHELTASCALIRRTRPAAGGCLRAAVAVAGVSEVMAAAWEAASEARAGAKRAREEENEGEEEENDSRRHAAAGEEAWLPPSALERSCAVWRLAVRRASVPAEALALVRAIALEAVAVPFEWPRVLFQTL